MRSRDYKKDLLKRLSNPEYAAVYLKTALNEAIEDGETAAFLLALRNVVAAQGSVQETAQRAKITRQHLHRLLNGNGNPTLGTLGAILKTLGIALDFRAAK